MPKFCRAAVFVAPLYQASPCHAQVEKESRERVVLMERFVTAELTDRLGFQSSGCGRTIAIPAVGRVVDMKFTENSEPLLACS
jgi:hypothetical protein